MATSGNYDLALTFNEVATEAFDILQIGADGETLSGDMITRAKSSYNLMIKEWQSQGIHLWSYEEGTLFLEVGREKYDFRDSTTKAANSWFETTTTSDTVASTTSIVVTDSSDIQDGDHIGIIQSDNNLFWTTVNGDPVSTTVNLIDAIPKETNAGAFVRNYRASTSTVPSLIPISRVLRVRRRENDDYEIPIVFESRTDYFDLPNKNQLGTPIQAHYTRQDLAGQIGGIMYLWNTPISSCPVINFTYERKLQIVVDPVNETVDVPDYAQLAVVYNLAERLLSKYGASPQRVKYIREEARKYMDNMLAYDSAVYPVVMDMQRYG